MWDKRGLSFLSFRAKSKGSRNEASGASDTDGQAAQVAANKSEEETSSISDHLSFPAQQFNELFRKACPEQSREGLNMTVMLDMSTSIRNRLPGTIEKIVSDKVVSEVVVRTAAGNVTSIITTDSVQRMNLKEGDNVFAIIKATEVSVEKE